ncbi:MAG: peptidyl-prolyl cis-trans isomerase [Bacteroidota bacterium]|nr:peptidyl-prolyl cis-trans isomerase [Bacteroidota bacterium]
MRVFNILFIVVLISLSSCLNINKGKEQKKIAKVNNKYLYDSDIKFLFKENISSEDSITIAENYINKWIKEQLLLGKAESYLPEEKMNIEKQIENYRTSLLIFKYKQMLVSQKLDTVVNDAEIVQYYDKYKTNFILSHDIVKILFLKIAKESPDIYKVKKWYKSDNEKYREELDDYCYQYANKYDNFNDNWIKFDELVSQIPIKINNRENYLKYRKYIETSDSLFYYFIKINDRKLIGSVQPLEYVRIKIKSIILNKRKFSYFDDLENRIYNDALDHNDFIIY